MGLRVLAALFLAITLHAAQERPVADATVGIPEASRGNAALATDGDGFLAVWTDGRTGAFQLFATRVTAAGEILAPTGIEVSKNGGEPIALWNGERYLVFWATGNRIRMVTIEGDGSVGAERTFLTAQSQAWLALPFAVATNGSHILVVYGANDDAEVLSHPRPRIAVANMNGELLRDEVLDPQRAQNLVLSIAVKDGQFVVTWSAAYSTDSSLRAVRFDEDGNRMDSRPRIIGDLPAALHPNGDAFVAVSEYFAWGVSANLSSYTPAVERPDGPVFQRDGRAALVTEQRVTHIDSTTPRTLVLQEFDAQGRLSEPRPVVSAAPDHSHEVIGASALTNGNDLLVTWTTYQYSTGGGTRLLRAVLDDETLAPRTGAADLTRTATVQRNPAVASSDTDTLVVWNELDGTYAGRLLPSGTRLDGRGVRLGDQAASMPAVAFNGSEYVVAFAGPDEVFIRFISPREGLRPEVIRLPSEWATVALVSDARSTVLAYAGHTELAAVRINESRQLEGLPVVLANGWADSPAIAWNGSEFLVAWLMLQVGPVDALIGVGIEGVRLNQSLQPLHAPRELSHISGHVYDDKIAVESHPNGWLLAWSSGPAYSGEAVVRVRLLDASATPFGFEDGQVIAAGTDPRLARSGNQFWLAWMRDSVYIAQFDANLAMSGAPIAAAPVPPQQFWSEDGIALSAKGPRVMAAYGRLSGPELGTVPRVYLLPLSELPAPPRRRSVR